MCALLIKPCNGNDSLLMNSPLVSTEWKRVIAAELVFMPVQLLNCCFMSMNLFLSGDVGSLNHARCEGHYFFSDAEDERSFKTQLQKHNSSFLISCSTRVCSCPHRSVSVL